MAVPLLQVMMGFIAEWETKLGVKIVCSQVGWPHNLCGRGPDSILNISNNWLHKHMALCMFACCICSSLVGGHIPGTNMWRFSCALNGQLAHALVP